MKKSGTKKETVSGGVITRTANAGKLVSVQTRSGTSKSTPKTVQTIEAVSNKRGAALQRLADR